MKPQPLKLSAADGMRTLCILIIALYHFWQQSWLEIAITIGGRRFTLLPLLRVGYIFVDVLILLSGFLLYLPYARSKFDDKVLPSLTDFYKKRAIRILPGYLLGIFVPLFLIAMPNHVYQNTKDMLHDLLPYLTFTQTFFKQSYQFSKLNAVLWTVGIEVQAYLLFPLAAKAFTKHPVKTYVAMLFMGFLYRYAILRIVTDLTIWVNQLPSFIDVYANGMMAAYLYIKLKDRKTTILSQILCTIGSCVSLVLIWKIVTLQSILSWDPKWLHLGQALFRYPLTLLASIWLLLTEWSFSGFRAIFGNAFMRWIAGISYAFYVWHQWLAVNMRVRWRFPPYNTPENPQFVGEMPWQALYMVSCFVVSLIVANFVTYGIERPIARWLVKNRRIAQKPT